MNPPAQTQRYFFFDSLRASLMFLGLAFHAVTDYVDLPFRSSEPSEAFALFLSGVHTFRMPLFYALAGFFAAYIYVSRGPFGLAWGRLQRIGIPLLVGALVLVPLCYTGTTFALLAPRLGTMEALETGWNGLKNGGFWWPARDNFAHLWFLYYLLLLYAAAIIAAHAAQFLPVRLSRTFMTTFGALVRSTWWRVPVLAAITAMVLWLLNNVSFDTPLSYRPSYQVFGAYAPFFVFGWLLYHHRGAIATFEAWAIPQTLLALLLIYPNFWAEQHATNLIEPNREAWAMAQALLSGLLIWLMFFGVTGIFMRFLNRDHAVVRYLVDSSYWSYLVHFPALMFMTGFLANTDMPPLAKVLAALVPVTAFCLLTYELLVRSTVIGAILNGRTQPRVLGHRRPRPVASEPGPAPSEAITR